MSMCRFVHANTAFTEAKRGHKSPRATVTWYWEPNSGPLEEQQELLITIPSLQLLWSLFLRQRKSFRGTRKVPKIT